MEEKEPQLQQEEIQAPEEQTTVENTETTLENTVSEEQSETPLKKKRKRRNPMALKKIKALEEELAKTTAELSEMKDKYLRIYAEFDNYRKRTIKEKEDLIKVASQASIKAILPTLDDFERAIRAAQEAQGEALPEGVVLIYEKLLRNLEAQGLKAMESTGQAFDADLHEALTNVPSPSEEMKGKVLDTVEKGYYLNDKIIRYAKVVVAQ